MARATKKSTAVTKAPSKGKDAVVHDELPEYLQSRKPVNNGDNFDQTDVSIPMVRLLQGLSEIVNDFPEAEAGNFWHTGVDMPLGDEFRFVIASRRKKYLLLAPIVDGQGVLASADDAKTWDKMGEWEVKLDKKNKAKWTISDLDVEASGLSEWGTSDPNDPDSPPAATLVYEYLILLPDHLELGPVVVSLARSAIRKARRGLNDKIQLQANNGRPIQSLVFRAKVAQDQSDAGPYFNWAFTSAGFASEALFLQAKEVAALLTTYKVEGEDKLNDDGHAATEGGDF